MSEENTPVKRDETPVEVRFRKGIAGPIVCASVGQVVAIPRYYANELMAQDPPACEPKDGFPPEHIERIESNPILTSVAPTPLEAAAENKARGNEFEAGSVNMDSSGLIAESSDQPTEKKKK